ncbi:SH3 domain-containing protein [Tropicibacter sp. R15_0]|uniref:SH3 domain-containing protein n=1 Tax=Tropicibacter sp. R15_0 TaxID=2821101 RepID=UPI001AD96E31|nr:SH3 domain-containing protein [Tropicibacter sp. R15_0]MBO9465885.1 SH3 domain-containing protein [Tropicibacter sp. R15_0]
MLRYLTLALCLAGPVAAQDFPALYNIVGVASDDTLNVRAKPTSKSPVIAERAHDETYIEVLQLDPSGKWALVNNGEAGQGWLFARYLEAVPGGNFPDWPHMYCGGSESPWGIRFTQGGKSELRQNYEPDGYPLMAGALRTGSEHLTDHGLRAKGDGIEVLISVRKEICHSTMIDAAYGLMSSVFVNGEDESFHQGCCRLMAPPSE